VQWFTPNDSTTARYLSGRVGKTTVTNTTLNRQASSGQTVGGGGPGRSIGETTSANESDLGVEFLSPQNLYDMPQGLQLLTLAGLSYPVCATREPYFAVSGLMGEALKERADPDPFHL
jgi:type IV secretory pathway TraG/TraD family ATPase VirD4